jgi:hypothetical protein
MKGELEKLAVKMGVNPGCLARNIIGLALLSPDKNNLVLLSPEKNNEPERNNETEKAIITLREIIEREKRSVLYVRDKT